ncbi:hypothetical protein M3J09_002594 [Ascochyta lentis]
MAQQQRSTDMQLAEILSDLVSLRPGDPAAALSLVSLRASPASTDLRTTTHNTDEILQSTNDNDTDLQRARDLVSLHYEVRERCKTGQLSRGLEAARREVERALSG